MIDKNMFFKINSPSDNNNLKAEFTTHFKENENIIHKCCEYSTSNEEDYKNLFQEISLRLWELFPKFNYNQEFKSWVYIVARNTATPFKRKAEKIIQTTDYITELSNSLESLIFDDQVEEPNLVCIYTEIDKLRKDYREVLELQMEGCSSTIISKKIGISPGNVRVKLSRAKNELRKSILENR